MMFQKIAKHRANDASLTMHRPPLSVDGDDVNSSLRWHNKHHLTKFISIDTYLSQMMVSEGLNNLFTESVLKGVGGGGLPQSVNFVPQFFSANFFGTKNP